LTLKAYADKEKQIYIEKISNESRAAIESRSAVLR